MAGHVVHEGDVGDFTICKYGMSKYCRNPIELREFAHELGVVKIELNHDAVSSALAGQRAATTLIAELRQGCAPQDALHATLQALRDTGDCERLRAFTRAIQKCLENADTRLVGVLK
ncbi:MAG: hypothetical protein ABIN37_09105 [Burkholderiaceae bacterium]